MKEKLIQEISNAMTDVLSIEQMVHLWNNGNKIDL